jgi:hypothetical protein
MTSDLAIPGVAPSGKLGDSPGQPKSAPGFAAGPVVRTEETPIHTNPSMRLDAALGLVVIEFRDSAGSVSTSIPSERQLQAYRQYERSRSEAGQPGPEGLAPGTPPGSQTPPPDVAAVAHAPRPPDPSA